MSPRLPVLALIVFICAMRAVAADEISTFTWMSETEEIQAEGVLWNDWLGDRRDRYKSGGLTQSWLLPQSLISEEPWFAEHAAAVEIQLRGLVITPDNIEAGAAADRPFAQYAAAGVCLRTFGRPRPLAAGTTLASEGRIGIELGYLGDPLPLFELQDTLHDATGSPRAARDTGNTLDPGFLANFEARRIWRLHTEAGDHEIEIAPFAHLSAGLRENSAQIGVDLIHGRSLRARTWNHEPAIGALIPGGAMPRTGIGWLVWFGGDVGIVVTDALLDGGFFAEGPGADPETFSARLRAGALLEFGDIAIGYSVAWLSPEFDGQREGQMIGAVQLKLRY